MSHLLLSCVHLATSFWFAFNPFQTHHHHKPHHHTPRISPTPSAVPSTSITITISPTITSTPSATLSPTNEPTPTTSPSATPTPTMEPTQTPTDDPSPTPTMTSTPTPTKTPTPTPTVHVTPTITHTPTPTIGNTPTASPTATLTLTPSPTASATPTLDPTASPTATPTATMTPTPTPTEIPTPTPTITKIGNDISYPQCNKPYPTGQGFGIVGVNGGIATTTNPCLASQLIWANLSLGTPNQAKVQLYVNTGNPGGLNTASWPSNNTDPAGNTAPNPFGTCDHGDSIACAWQYGWNRAIDDVQNKFVPAAQTAGISTNAADFPWWLDVETTNSWKSGSDFAYQSNRATLEGMVAAFQSRGITPGIYSTNYQWGVIIGTVPAGSNLMGLRNWRAGASDLATAQSYCGLVPLTTGGIVALTQFTTDFDYNYSCL